MIWLMTMINPLLILFLLLSPWAVAAQDMYPIGCAPWVIKKAEPTLKYSQPTLMFVHNLSDNDLWITEVMHKKSGVKAGFSSLLQPGKWSALTLGGLDHQLTLRCIESQPGHEQAVPCSEVMALCQWTKAKLPDAEQTSLYWAGENMDFKPLKAYIERRGFNLETE